jgi:hypothetical protein
MEFQVSCMKKNMRTEISITAGSRALSMVEIIVALAIIAFGLIPVFSMFGSTSSEISSTIDEIMLAGYANELIDSVINHPYADIPESFSMEDISLAGTGFSAGLKNKLSVLKPGYTRGLEITKESVKVDPELYEGLDPFSQKKFNMTRDLKIIRASVKYAPKNGRPRKMEICTFAIPD